MAKKASTSASKAAARAVAEPPGGSELLFAAKPPSAVVGHERAFEVLFRAMRSGRVHHSWIFQGPTGVGKLTSALAFASVLLDPTTQATFSGALEPDEGSATQRLLAAGTHPDLRVICKEMSRFHDDARVRGLKQTAISVDVVRQFLVEPAKLGAQLRTESAVGKVFVIDEAELMNASAQNAVLKTLEEPPPRTVLLLVTSNEERLLPTIRSRSQRVYFGPLDDAAMRRWLSGPGAGVVGVVSGIGAEELEWLCWFAEGAPGVLTLAARTGIGGWWRQLSPMLLATADGTFVPELGGAMAKLADAWAAAWVEAHDNASKEAANKAAADWMFRLLARFARDGLARAAGGGALSGGGGSRAEPWLQTLDAVRAAEGETDANVNLTFVMDKLAAEMIAAFAGAPAR